jgi:glycosyltransferase involved in cell wall biosynthesis
MSPCIQVFFINKFDIEGESPMATVSVMSTHALAVSGIPVTLIAEGNPKTDTRAFLRDRFGFSYNSNYTLKLMSRKLFGKFRATTIFYYRAILFILRKRLRYVNTIVITRNTTFLPRMILLRAFGCKVFFESHGYHGAFNIDGVQLNSKGKTFCLNSQYRWIERYFLNRCNGLICISRVQRELYIKDFVRIPSVTLPLGSPHVNRSDQTGNYNIKKNLVYIGRAASFIEDKVIFEAISMCKDKTVTFTWLGLRDEDFERLRALADDNGISERVRLHKWMSHSEMSEHICKEAGAGIVAYKFEFMTAALACPTKLFDYFGAGLPVIASRMPTVEDYMTHGKEGLFYTPGSPESFCDAIETLFSDSDRYITFCKNSRDAAERYSWENRAHKLLHFVTSA